MVGALQWYGDLLGLAFLVFLLAGALNLALGAGSLFRKLSLFLVATVPVLFLLGLVRAVALLRRGTGATWRDAVGAGLIRPTAPRRPTRRRRPPRQAHRLVRQAHRHRRASPRAHSSPSAS